MVKRRPDTQLTKDDPEGLSNKQEGGNEGPKSSADQIAKRPIYKAKRKSGAAAAAGGSGFNLAADKPAAGGFGFDFGAKKPTKNAFQALIDTSQWECPSCGVRNNKDATTCASCEVPKPKAKAAAPAAAKPVVNGGVNAFAALIDTSQWECASCGVRNKKEDAKCKACETPKAGAAAPAEQKFTFGGPPTGSSGFTFGGSATSSDNPFKFGSGTGFTAPSFGSTGGGFGEVSKDGPKFGESKKEVFGSAQSEVNPEFKDKKAEPTGTEKDKSLFKIQTKVFIMKTVETKDAKGEVKKKPSFVERGEGELNINTVSNEGKKIARVVLRADKTHRVVLNALLYKGMTLGLQGEKFVKFCSRDCSAAADVKPDVYLLKLKDKTQTTMVLAKMKEAIATLD